MLALVFWTKDRTTSVVLEKNLQPIVSEGNVTSVLYKDDKIYEAKVVKKSYDKGYLTKLTVDKEGNLMTMPKITASRSALKMKGELQETLKQDKSRKNDMVTLENFNLLKSSSIFSGDRKRKNQGSKNHQPDEETQQKSRRIEKRNTEDKRQREDERQRELERQSQDERQRELERQSQDERQRELERQRKDERQRELERQRKDERKRELERQRQDERKRELERQRQDERQRELERQKKDFDDDDKMGESDEEKDKSDEEKDESDEEKDESDEEKDESDEEKDESDEEKDESDEKKEESDEENDESDEEKDMESENSSDTETSEGHRREEQHREEVRRERERRLREEELHEEEYRREEVRRERERRLRDEELHEEERERNNRRINDVQRRDGPRDRRNLPVLQNEIGEDPLQICRIPGNGRILICEDFNVWIDRAFLTVVNRWKGNPKEMTRRLLKKIVGAENLKRMCARGRSTRYEPIPEDIISVVEYYVNRKCSPGLTPAEFTTAINMMCGTLRNPRQ